MAKKKSDKNVGLVPRCVSVPLGWCLGFVPKPHDPFAADGQDFGDRAEKHPVILRGWRLATDTANAAVHELFRRDVRRLPGMTTFPKWVPVDLFKEWLNDKASEPFKTAFAAFVGAKGSGADILRSVRESYTRQRHEVIWKGEAWPLSYRYPYPWPVRRQEWRLKHSPATGWLVSITLPGGRYVFELKTGPDFRRQEADLHRIVAGEANAGALRLCPMKTDGHVVGVMLRLSGFFQPADKAGTNAAFIHTDPKAFLVVEVAGRSPWILNADHLRRAFAVIATGQERHKVFLQRTREDLKFEKRLTRRQRKNLLKRVGQRCDKHAARMDTALHQLAAQVIRFCVRQGVSIVAYDDHIKTFLPDGFQWFEFASRLRHKAELAGMTWIDHATPNHQLEAAAARSRIERDASASGEAVNENPGSARDNGGSTGTKTCASAKRSRNGRADHRVRTRSRNAAKIGPGERLVPAAPESPNRV